MSFDDLASALIKRLRQTLAERVQLEDESISDYACSLRKLFARVNLPRRVVFQVCLWLAEQGNS